MECGSAYIVKKRSVDCQTNFDQTNFSTSSYHRNIVLHNFCTASDQIKETSDLFDTENYPCAHRELHSRTQQYARSFHCMRSVRFSFDITRNSRIFGFCFTFLRRAIYIMCPYVFVYLVNINTNANCKVSFT